MGCIFVSWLLLVRAGATLGGEGDLVAVRELGLPSFETSVGTPAVEPEAETPGRGASVRKREAEMEAQPFVLSETLPVVPAKLAKKITRGEFVDTAELLKANIKAERRRLV